MGQTCLRTFRWCYIVSDKILGGGHDLPLELIQSLLREGNEIEKESADTSKASCRNAAECGQEDAHLLKQSADLQESLTFELVEFWRQHLIVYLVGSISTTSSSSLTLTGLCP